MLDRFLGRFFGRKLRRLVDSLPATPDAIAELLVKEDCYGYRRSNGRCPLANYLKKHGVKNVVVGVYTVFDDTSFFNFEIECKLPKQASEFIKQFDSGKYPELRTGTPE